MIECESDFDELDRLQSDQSGGEAVKENQVGDRRFSEGWVLLKKVSICFHWLNSFYRFYAGPLNHSARKFENLECFFKAIFRGLDFDIL